MGRPAPWRGRPPAVEAGPWPVLPAVAQQRRTRAERRWTPPLPRPPRALPALPQTRQLRPARLHGHRARWNWWPVRSSPGGVVEGIVGGRQAGRWQQGSAQRRHASTARTHSFDLVPLDGCSCQLPAAHCRRRRLPLSERCSRWTATAGSRGRSGPPNLQRLSWRIERHKIAP